MAKANKKRFVQPQLLIGIVICNLTNRKKSQSFSHCRVGDEGIAAYGKNFRYEKQRPDLKEAGLCYYLLWND